MQGRDHYERNKVSRGKVSITENKVQGMYRQAKERGKVVQLQGVYHLKNNVFKDLKIIHKDLKMCKVVVAKYKLIMYKVGKKDVRRCKVDFTKDKM